MARTIPCKQIVNEGLVEFLQSVADQATKADKQRQAATYRKAILGIKQSDIIFSSGHQTKKEIRGVGPVLEKRIDAYFRDHPVTIEPFHDTNKENQNPSNIILAQKQATKRSVPVVYVPRVSSGPWVILKCFSLLGSNSTLRTKEEIATVISELGESKVTCWRSINPLIKRGIIIKMDGGYKLSESGIQSATKIKPKPFDITQNGSHSQVNRVRGGSKRGPGRSKPCDSSDLASEFRRLSIDPELYSQNFTLFSHDNSTESIVAGEITFKNVVLLIDTREMQFQGSTGKKKAFLKEMLDDMGIDCETRNLSVGDMVWLGITSSGEEMMLEYVIERKAIDDLCSSIIDGRYAEQKHRLKRSSFKKIIYLLEGNTNHMFARSGSYRATFTAQTLHKALCSTQVTSHFRTHNTKTLEDTALFLRRTTNMLQKKYLCTKNQGRSFPVSEFVSYSDFSSENTKSGDLSVQDLYAKTLLQISGCSPERVHAIVTLYPTFVDLKKAYNAVANPKEGELLLSQIVAGASQRKIGPVLSKRIYNIYTIKN